MKYALWVLVPVILLLVPVGGIVARMAMAQNAADKWLALGQPHPTYGITTYGHLFPWHRDKMIATLERCLPQFEARAKKSAGAIGTPVDAAHRPARILENIKAQLASLKAGRAFYTKGGATVHTGSGSMKYAVRFDARLMFDGSEGPIPPVRGFGALWAKMVNTKVTVNIAIPY